jgi:hypothetical protein
MSWADMVSRIPSRVLSFGIGLALLAIVALIGTTIYAFVAGKTFYVSGVRFGGAPETTALKAGEPLKLCHYAVDGVVDGKEVHWADTVIFPPGSVPELCKNYVYNMVGNRPGVVWVVGCLSRDEWSWGARLQMTEPQVMPVEPVAPLDDFCHWRR